MEKATVGGGCFWCTEAVFDQLIGVDRVISGYAGGVIENPSYEAVCSGTTGHAEVVESCSTRGEFPIASCLRYFLPFMIRPT